MSFVSSCQSRPIRFMRHDSCDIDYFKYCFNFIYLIGNCSELNTYRLSHRDFDRNACVFMAREVVRVLPFAVRGGAVQSERDVIAWRKTIETESSGRVRRGTSEQIRAAAAR